jgi:hypothetical protein
VGQERGRPCAIHCHEPCLLCVLDPDGIHKRGQSIGKMALKIKTTDLEGRTPDIKSAVIQSFGKSFLLVIDVAAGWIFTNDKRQRIFSRASHTIVVKEQGDGASNPENVRYTKS